MSPTGLPGARATADGFALIADDAVDAVVIASHDSTHAALAIAAVRAGKPVLCEKPLAPTLAECVEVVRAERAAIGAAGLPLISLGFMRRFDPGYVAAEDRRSARRRLRDTTAGPQHQPRGQFGARRHRRVQRHRLGDSRVRRGAMASRLADRRGELARRAQFDHRRRASGIRS